MRERAHVFAAVAAACLLTGRGPNSTSVAIAQPPPALIPQTTNRTQPDASTPLAPPGQASTSPITQGGPAGGAAPPGTASTTAAAQGPHEGAAANDTPAQHAGSIFEERHAPAAIDTFL